MMRYVPGQHVDNIMKDYAKKCGLDFENYVLHDGKKMTVDIGKGIDSDRNIRINLKGMVSYDKLKLIQDMIKGTNVVYNKAPDKNTP